MQLALGKRQGVARVAWRVGQGVPIAQCVDVLREGVLDGAKVELLSISKPLSDGQSCIYVDTSK
jgi:hypothetical protein